MKKSNLILLFVLFGILTSTISLGNNQKKKEEALRLIKEGVISWNNGQIDSAIIYLNQAEECSRLINDSAYLVACYNNLGILYTDTGSYKESLSSFQNAYNHLPDTLSEEACKIILNIGIVYRKLGVYDKALGYFTKVLNYESDVLSVKLKASFYNEYAIVKKKQREFYSAIDYFTKSLEIYRSLDDEKNIAGALNNIGNCYRELRKFDIALSNLNQSIRLKSKFGNKKLLSIAYINIGDVQLRLKDIANAEKSLLQALRLKQELGDKAGIASACTLLSEVYYEKEQYNKVEDYLLRGKKIAEEIGALDLQREVYLHFKNLYAAQNKGKEALVYYDSYIAVKDSIFNTESMKNMQELETRYQTREKENQIKLLSLESKNKDLELEQSRQRSLYLGGGLILLILGLLPLGFFVKQRQKNKLLEERIAGENRECTRISRELHDGVASSLGYLCRHMEREHPEAGFAEKLRRISDEVRGISHQLNMNAIAAQDFCSSLSDSLLLNHFPEDIGLQIHLPEDFEIADYKVKINLIRIVQELVNNSLKHAQASTIVVKFREQNRKLFLEYADDGIGMDFTQQQKGNGLINIEERVAYLSGKMEMTTAPGEGFYLKVLI
ncbi:MAG: tetratricopeptide repeat protein [Marinifilaceae bacterium]